MLRHEVPDLSEPDIDLLTIYAIKGSKRSGGEKSSHTAQVDLKSDLIQFKHFELAISQVIHEMKSEENKRIQKEQEYFLQTSDVERLRREMEKKEEE